MPTPRRRLSDVLPLTAEDTLHQLEDGAALLRYLAALAAASPEQPDPAVLSGISDLCHHLESLARATRQALSIHALATAVPLHDT